MKKKVISLAMAVVLTIAVLNAQNTASHQVSVSIPEVALIGLTATESSVGIPGHNTNEVIQTLDISEMNISEVWLNYTSVPENSQRYRKIIAMLSGTLPNGIKLSVEASPFTGTGKGKTGTSCGKKILSAEPSEIISDIGSCYTGKGEHNGHLLSFSVEVDQNRYKEVQPREMRNLSITYTLSK